MSAPAPQAATGGGGTALRHTAKHPYSVIDIDRTRYRVTHPRIHLIRYTFPTAAVLSALVHGFGYGFEIVDVTGLRAGTVYPVLRRLEARGLVRSSWERASVARAEGRPSRRNYELTEAGHRAADEAEERYPALARMFGPGRDGSAAEV